MPDPGGDPDADAFESDDNGRCADPEADNGTRSVTNLSAAENTSISSTGSPATVLVVEDNQALAGVFREWLAEIYEVRVANTGAEALDQLEDAVDVVLLDRRLPGISGSEVLDAIRASDGDYQVAMVTAVDPDEDVFEMGFDDYVTKPVARDELRSLVASLVARYQYSECVQWYFRLLSKRATIEREFDGDLADSPDYQQLLADITAVEADLGALVEGFTTRDFDAQFHWFSEQTTAASD